MQSCNCKFIKFFQTSVGKKYVMGITGLLLCGFLLAHLAGNFSLLFGADAFNFYAHQLTKNKALLYIAEAGLIVLFLSHIVMAIKLTLENKAARPEKYYMKNKTGRGETFASSTMPITGMIILVFLVTHLMHFKYGSYYVTNLEGESVRDIYRTVIEYFASPIWVAWYVFAMIVTGLHVSHGFQSAFQSLGFNHPKYTPILKLVSCLFAIFVATGFSTLAIWCHFQA